MMHREHGAHNQIRPQALQAYVADDFPAFLFANMVAKVHNRGFDSYETG